MILNELNKPYIIAEIGCNHNGDTDLGLDMIRAAKESGADAVKFQYFTKNNLTTSDYLADLHNGNVKLENVDKWESKKLGLKNIYEQVDAFINDKNQLIIFQKYAKEIGLDFGCTPVDADGLNFLKDINSDFIKLASMDADNLEMIDLAISSDLPIIISTGMANLQEIDNIYKLFQDKGFTNYALLHCVSLYPPKDELINLNFIDTLNEMYDCEIGYSDHSLGYSVTLAAIAKGVKIIEKHFTLDKNMDGWDHKVSADEEDLRIICREGLKIYKSLGSGEKILSREELLKRDKFRRSATTINNLKKGHTLLRSDLVYKRPGTGISPSEISNIVGRKLKHDIDQDKTLFMADFE